MNKEERRQKFLADNPNFLKYIEDRQEIKKLFKISLDKWKVNNPLKIKAQRKVYAGLRNGTLKRKPCFCGNIKFFTYRVFYNGFFLYRIFFDGFWFYWTNIYFPHGFQKVFPLNISSVCHNQYKERYFLYILFNFVGNLRLLCPP